MARILIADDHAIVREGLKKILRDEMPHLTFGDARTGKEALEQCQSGHWDVVLLDMTLPLLGGLDVLKALAAGHNRTRILVVSMHPESLYAKRALQLGAMGYLTKESLPQELVGAVRKVLGGGRYVSASLAESLATDVGPASVRPPHEALSDREFEVLRLIASGRKTVEVAEGLGISPKTVSTYRTRILDKMKMKTNSELVAYCMHHGLVG